MPFKVEQAKSNDDMKSEGNGAEDSAQANVREGNVVGKQCDHKLWVTPGPSDKEVAQNWPEEAKRD